MNIWFLKRKYAYELIKHHEKENESNGLMDNVLEEYYNIFLTNLWFHIHLYFGWNLFQIHYILFSNIIIK